jgi:cytoskeletal protein CcmA (bactofilin family)
MKERDKISTYLGKDTRLEGILKFCGTIRIDSYFQGEILGEGTLIIGEGATIKSGIHVSKILNSGEVQGNLIADERIEIRAPGKVLGNIQTPCIVINEGAVIEGNCQMGQLEETDERKLTFLSSDKSAISLSS